MSLRKMLPAGFVLALLAGCSGTATSTADEQAVGFDAAPKACCHSADGAAKGACTADQAKECSEKKECPMKPAADPVKP